MNEYGVILADPPWYYTNSNVNGAAAKHYPTMKTKDICSLPVEAIAAENSVLLMWCTWPLLKDGLKVVDAWGFKYVTGFPMIKVKEAMIDIRGDLSMTVPYGGGFWVRGCTEFVMICKRGKPRNGSRNFIGLISPHYKHSRKPENLHHLAESLDGPYLELFARRNHRPNWNYWGNQVSSVILPGFPLPEHIEKAAVK